jgi:hypothetical protein
MSDQPHGLGEGTDAIPIRKARCCCLVLISSCYFTAMALMPPNKVQPICSQGGKSDAKASSKGIHTFLWSLGLYRNIERVNDLREGNDCVLVCSGLERV